MNYYKYEIFLLLIPYIDYKFLCIKDENGQTCWHHLLSSGFNDYKYTIVKKLIFKIPPYQNPFSLQDNNKNTCWHLLFQKMNNIDRADIFKLIFPYLNLRDFELKNNRNMSLWHLIFNFNTDQINDFKLNDLIISILVDYLHNYSN